MSTFDYWRHSYFSKLFYSQLYLNVKFSLIRRHSQTKRIKLLGPVYYCFNFLLFQGAKLLSYWRHPPMIMMNQWSTALMTAAEESQWAWWYLKVRKANEYINAYAGIPTQNLCDSTLNTEGHHCYYYYYLFEYGDELGATEHFECNVIKLENFHNVVKQICSSKFFFCLWLFRVIPLTSVINID